MTGYTRQKSAEIVLGAVARASDIGAELDQVQSAFNSTTGHNHSGVAGEGSPITVIGPAQDFIATGSLIRPKTDNVYDLGSSTFEFKDGYFDGTLYTDAINLNGTLITSTAAELNILDGVTATAAELNILDGVTATAAELNFVDGVTSSIQTQLDSTVKLTGNQSITGTKSFSAIDINGGSINGITDLAVADGGTGASDAATARANLGAAASATQINSGTGITGGGDLTTNRTLSLTGQALNLHNLSGNGLVMKTGTAGSGTASVREIVGANGVSVVDGNGVSGNPTVSVDSTVVRTSRVVSAGDGLTGGGNFTLDREIALGTPSSITATSTNSVTATSHTHALSESAVRTLIADGSAGAVGTYAFLRRSTVNTGIAAGTRYDASELRYSGVSTTADNWNAEVEGPNNTQPPGSTNSWQAMGSVAAKAGCYAMTLFLRVA